MFTKAPLPFGFAVLACRLMRWTHRKYMDWKLMSQGYWLVITN